MSGKRIQILKIIINQFFYRLEGLEFEPWLGVGGYFLDTTVLLYKGNKEQTLFPRLKQHGCGVDQLPTASTKVEYGSTSYLSLFAI
jgi:hypothetical protein